MKKKFLSIILMMTLLIFSMATIVNALSFTATMTPSATTVAEASEFTITIKVSNLDVGANGINSLNGYLKYDSEVFETISESSIEGLNGWVATFDATTGKIGLTKNTFVTSAQEVINIAFKTKTGVSGKSGTISYSNIVASNSESDIAATDISTSIAVGTGTTGTADPSTVGSNTTSNVSVITANTSSTGTNTTSINTVGNNSTNTTVSSYVNTMTNTTSEDDMPQTGVNDTILVLIFIVIAIAMIFYLKIDKLNKDIY